MTGPGFEAGSPSCPVNKYTPPSLDTRAPANWTDVDAAPSDSSGLSHPAALFRRVWEGPSHQTGALHTQPENTWVALQTLFGLANRAGGDGRVMSRVCFVCPALVIPVWEQSLEQESKSPGPLVTPLIPLQHSDCPKLGTLTPLHITLSNI